MAEAPVQTYASHRRYDPIYHIFTFLILAISILVSLWRAVRNPGFDTVWLTLVFAALMALFFKVRLYALKVQDRVIRLEERLRLERLLPGPLKERIGELTEKQLVGLRFAPDGEAAELVKLALDEGLSGEEIKKRIRGWRADTFRV
jgi:hypothetical protein